MLSRFRPAPASVFCCLFLTATGSAQERDLIELSLQQLGEMKVTSASLHEESLRDAPASVTVITAEDIRKFGYRTLPDALSYVRGFYISSDHTYTAIGIRGFSLAGYEVRFVLMLNGHAIADNIFAAALTGNDFPVDLDLVDRIEIVRGPSSALYGNNGMLATINVITRHPADSHGTAIGIETGTSGERKVAAHTSVALGKQGSLLVSTSVFNNAGAHQLYFPELDRPETNFGRAVDADGEKGYHALVDLTWGNWEALAVAGDRVKVQPISWGNTVFNDPGTRAEDSRGFFELSYTRLLSGDRSFSWQTSYDAYRYRGIYHYPPEILSEGVGYGRENDYGDWLSSKVTYRLPDSRTGRLTIGAEFKADVRALMHTFEVAPHTEEFLNIDQPDRYVGVFAQQEWNLGRHWDVVLGARFDWSWLKRNSVSPRVALIYKPSSSTDIKVMYGRGFRNPITYNMFYSDPTQAANPSLRPETSDTFEVDLERDFAHRFRASASLYHYRVHGLIQQTYNADGLVQYVNGDHVHATGGSLEITCLLPGSIEMTSSVVLQRASSGSGPVLPNSPGQVGKLHLAAPLGRLWTLSAGLQALGQRRTYAGADLPWVVLPEAAISSKDFLGGLQLSAGVENLSNTFYREPVGLGGTVDSMIGSGRTYFLKLMWNSETKDSRTGK